MRESHELPFGKAEPFADGDGIERAAKYAAEPFRCAK